MEDKQYTTPAGYGVQVKTIDGTTLVRFRVPTRRGGAWFPIPDLYSNRELAEALLVCPDDEAWKREYLWSCYREYRQYRNETDKRLGDVRVDEGDAKAQAGLAYYGLEHVLQTPSVEDEVLVHITADALLGLLTDKQRKYLVLSLGGWSFMDIARQELPGAKERDVTSRADAIRKVCSRAKAALKKKLDVSRPDCRGANGE